MLGLVLTAGGARGAYQAGVLKRLGEVPALRDGPSPFAIVAGASAGAINGTLLAAHGARFGEATREIARFWSSSARRGRLRERRLHAWRGPARRSPATSCSARLLGRTRTHGAARHRAARAPARAQLPAARDRARQSGAASSTPSRSPPRAITRAAPSRSSRAGAGHPVWAKSRRLVLPVDADQPTRAGVGGDPDRVPAGASRRRRPGDLWFGDGGLRLVTPFSPAIRLGATHILRRGRALERARPTRSRARRRAPCRRRTRGRRGCRARRSRRYCGVFLNAIFLDHLDTDLDHSRRMNEIVASGRRDTAGVARERADARA